MKLFVRLRCPKKARGNILFRYGWKITLLFLLAGAAFAVFLFYGTWAQTFDMKNVGEMPERSTVYDVDGKLYSRLAGANRLKVSLSEVSPQFMAAVLAREDARFYDHKGIDWRGVLRALARDVVSMSAKEGASSLTMQLARNSLPLGGRTFSRKLLEAMVALRIEREFTKQQILELYVNRIYFGTGCYGVETASLAYFGKNASKLNLSEAALLAGLIRGPNRFSPLKNPEGAAIQRDAVLDRMVALKKITPAQAEQAKKTKIVTHPKRMPQIQENYAMDAVQRALSLILTQDQMDDGGLSIYTTLDPSVQNSAQDALEAQLSKIERQSNFRHKTKAEYKPPENGEGDAAMPYLEGAVVVIDNASGGIRALVGGRDYAQSKFNRALAPANRQVGSAFKPFVYAIAFSHGLLPGAAISDGPIQPGEIDGAGNWSPGNSDGTYGGTMPCSYGLVHSRNTMSVRVGQFAGLDAVQKVANDFGIAQNIPHGPASYIGSFESNLKDLASAYTVFPNAGVRRQAYIIERIDDQQHKPIYLAAHITSQAIDPGAAWMTSEVMEDVLTKGTAASARSSGFELPAAGKTGTTNDYKDAWFVGYTSTLTCGVWVGFDQPTTIVSRGYGAALALPVWTQVMNKASRHYPAEPLQPRVAIQRATVCSISNQLATTGCTAAGSAYDIDLPVNKIPTGACQVHGGMQWPFAQQAPNVPSKAGDFPSRMFKSFRRFFGGR
jgi:penicillin-binding protein 1A